MFNAHLWTQHKCSGSALVELKWISSKNLAGFLQGPCKIPPRTLQDSSKDLAGFLQGPCRIPPRTSQDSSKDITGFLQGPCRSLVFGPRSLEDIRLVSTRVNNKNYPIFGLPSRPHLLRLVSITAKNGKPTPRRRARTTLASGFKNNMSL